MILFDYGILIDPLTMTIDWEEMNMFPVNGHDDKMPLISCGV